jgi:hypothetical protein
MLFEPSLRRPSLGAPMLAGLAATLLLVSCDGAYTPDLAADPTVRSDKSPTRVVHDEWSRYCRFSVVEKGHALLGYYDSLLHWAVDRSDGASEAEGYPRWLAEIRNNIDLPLAAALSPAAVVAVVGTGGGEQLAALLEARPARIYAAEIVPDVFPVMQALGVEALSDPRVVKTVGDGRKFLEDTRERFDLVYFPLTESNLRLVRNLFDPADRLFTVEAFRTYLDRLDDDGVLVIRKVGAFAAWTAVVPNYMRTMWEAGFDVAYVRRADQFVIMGARSPGALLARGAVLGGIAQGRQQGQALAAEGQVLTDQRPYLANVWAIPNLQTYLWIIFAAVTVGVVLGARRLEAPVTAMPPLFTGLNYTGLLLGLQLVLFVTLRNPLNSHVLGGFAFLALIGLGSLFYRRPGVLAALGVVIAVSAAALEASPLLTVMGLLILGSGGLFPRLIHQYASALPRLFIFDGLGAGLAGLLYLIVPGFWGVYLYLGLLVLVFIGAVAWVRWAGRASALEGTATT